MHTNLNFNGDTFKFLCGVDNYEFACILFKCVCVCLIVFCHV